MKRLLIILFMCIFFISCSTISNFETKVIAGATSECYIRAQIKNKDKLTIKVYEIDDDKNCIDEYESPFINRKKITVGISYEDFISKFGKPANERIFLKKNMFQVLNDIVICGDIFRGVYLKIL